MADLTPAPMDDAEVTLAICELLGEIDGWTFTPDEVITAEADLIIFAETADDRPDRAVAVRLYDGGDDPETGLAYRMVQLKFRGAPHDLLGANRLAGIAFEHLRTVASRRGIAWLRRTSFAPAKTDGNHRAQRTDNYRSTLEHPEASLT